MRINANPTCSANFRAIDRKYLKWAQSDYVHCDNINVNWFNQFGDDVSVFEKIKQKDTFDTLNIVKNYISKDSKDYFDKYIKDFVDYFKKIQT